MEQTITMPPIAQVAELQKNYRSLFDRVKKTRLPLFLLKQNRPDVVILEPNFFQEIARKANLYEKNKALKKHTADQSKNKFSELTYFQEKNGSFDFLLQEPDIYSLKDVKQNI